MGTSHSNIISEEKIVHRIRQREKQALEYLYDNYSPALYGVILRIVGDEKVAEEILQDAFVKIWLKIASYDSKKGRLFTWMLNLSRNLAIDRLRSKEYKKSSKTDLIENNVYVIESRKFDTQKPDVIGIKELLNSLGDEQKLIVKLLYFKGYTQSEVSKEYNIPLGTVKTRLRAAIKQLRKLLNLK